MKKLIYILPIFIISCSNSFIIKKDGEYKKEFVIDREYRNGKYTVYVDEDRFFFINEKSRVYHRRDIADKGDTLYLEDFMKRYIKVKNGR